MKSELLVILALAAALAFHRHDEGSACGPSGCLLLPPDFQQSIESVSTEMPVVTAAGH